MCRSRWRNGILLPSLLEPARNFRDRFSPYFCAIRYICHDMLQFEIEYRRQALPSWRVRRATFTRLFVGELAQACWRCAGASTILHAAFLAGAARGQAVFGAVPARER